jgi:hypothetical protein
LAGRWKGGIDKGTVFEQSTIKYLMPLETFPFTYNSQSFNAQAENLPSANGYRKYRLYFPNVQSIVEGSVYLNETPEGEWEIDKIMSADPVHEEFLHAVSQGFVEFVDAQKAAS